MEPDEIVVARLNQGATVLRYVDRTPSRVTLALGRNKQAKLPADRVLYATGIVPRDYEGFLKFRDGAEKAAKEIDLSEVWEVAVDEQVAMSVKEIADLYYDSGLRAGRDGRPDAASRSRLRLLRPSRRGARSSYGGGT